MICSVKHCRPKILACFCMLRAIGFIAFLNYLLFSPRDGNKHTLLLYLLQMYACFSFGSSFKIVYGLHNVSQWKFSWTILNRFDPSSSDDSHVPTVVTARQRDMHFVLFSASFLRDIQTHPSRQKRDRPAHNNRIDVSLLPLDHPRFHIRMRWVNLRADHTGEC